MSDALGIMRLEEKNRLRVEWGNRTQTINGQNDIEYEYRTTKMHSAG